jgi:hypothetical protein
MDNVIFEKHLIVNKESILKSKKENFFKRSIWKYLLAAFLISFVFSDLVGNIFSTFLIVSIGLISFSYLLIHISSKKLSEKLGIDAKIKFNDEGINIYHSKVDLENQSIKWEEIYKIHETKKTLIIDFDKLKPHMLIFKKEELEKNEIDYLKQKR